MIKISISMSYYHNLTIANTKVIKIDSEQITIRIFCDKSKINKA